MKELGDVKHLATKTATIFKGSSRKTGGSMEPEKHQSDRFPLEGKQLEEYLFSGHIPRLIRRNATRACETSASRNDHLEVPSGTAASWLECALKSGDTQPAY